MRVKIDLCYLGLSRGKRAAGDLIPWVVSEQFSEPSFAGLSGARVVRIATNPDYSKTTSIYPKLV